MAVNRYDPTEWFDPNPTSSRAAKRGTRGFIELFVSSRAFDEPELKAKRNRIEGRLRKLHSEGTIPGFTIHDNAWNPYVSERHRRNRGGSLKFALDRYDEFKRSIQRLGRTLFPEFQEDVWHDSTTGKSGPYIQFPDLCLAVQQSPSAYDCVFPHHSPEAAFTIDHYLTSREEDTDWNRETSQSELQFADPSYHGVLKAHIVENSDELFGSEWQFGQDEKPIQGSTESSTGRADLVFYNGRKRLFVEVKTDREGVNKAFGQLRSYVIRESDWYRNDAEDIEMVIAAPRFADYHKTMADEWGFTLCDLSGRDISAD